MDMPVVKLAVAAVIIAAVFFGLFELLDRDIRSGVVWADVAKRMEASGGMVSRIRQTTTLAERDQPITTVMICHVSPGDGVMIENYDGDQISVTTATSYADGTLISLMHGMKTYTQRDLSEEELAAAAQAQSGRMDPEAIVKQFLAGGHKELGRELIDDVEVEGIEVTNPVGFKSNFQVDSCVARLWVSVDTGYPVLLESDIVGNGGDIRVEQIVDQFEWDVEFDPEMFQLEIPPDYTEMQGGQTSTRTTTIKETRTGTVTRRSSHTKMQSEQKSERKAVLRGRTSRIMRSTKRTMTPR